MRPLWGGCDREAACEMVHYGWACAASWQMLRHASETGGEPAGGGRGRRDAAAAATAAACTPSIDTEANPVMLRRKKRKKTTPLLQCGIKTVRFIGLSVHWTPTSEELDSSCCSAAALWCASFCANRLRLNLQPTALPLFHCAKRRTPQTSASRSRNQN